MKNLDHIVEKIDKFIDEKDKTREEALRSSRDIIIYCRKAIQSVHRNMLDSAEGFLSQAGDKLVQLYSITKQYPDLSHIGFVENAAQEYVEARCLLHIMKGEDLPDPDELKTTYSAYLLGLCDVVGELRRGALDCILIGDAEKAHTYLQFMDDIYDAIMSLDYPSGLIPIKRKQDVVRSLIEKTRGELAVASCERRIGEKTHEFQGLLDGIHSNQKQEKKTKKGNDPELDLNKIW